MKGPVFRAFHVDEDPDLLGPGTVIPFRAAGTSVFQDMAPIAEAGHQVMDGGTA